jgi:hypothetical protein
VWSNFLADVLDMDVHGARSNPHLLRYLGVGQTVRYPIENLILTWCKFLALHRLSSYGGEAAWVGAIFSRERRFAVC